MAELDFEAISLDVFRKACEHFEYPDTPPSPIERHYIQAYASALRNSYEQGYKSGYIKGSDDMGNVVVQLWDANK